MSRTRFALTLLALAAVPVTFGADLAPDRRKAPASRGAAPVLERTELAEYLAPCQERLEALRDHGDEHGYDERALVATLPDPVDSHFRREFDLLLAAMRRALEERYLQDRHCLPWEPEAGDSEGQAFHRSLPGVLLFRRDPDPASDSGPGARGEILAVYLVGEVPAWGVQTEALKVALDQAAFGLGWQEPQGRPADVDVPEELKVLGPTFSGSTRSLAVTLDAWRERRGAPTVPQPSFRVVSGTATSPGNRGVLEQVLGEDGVKFRTTVTDHGALQDLLWNQFVPERLGLRTSLDEGAGEDEKSDNRAVALLVESSLYGLEFKQKGFHVIPFPMHVSQLRAEYAKNRSDPATGRQGGTGQELWRQLPTLDLDLTGGDDTLDAVPVFDRNLTSRTQDLVLSNILTTIAQNRIAVVAIVASDTVDKLFLAEVLRNYAPDVRLVTFEGDLLLAHPKYTSATQGMLVVSSNPLTDPDPLSPRDGGVELQFASDIAQGLFEATREIALDRDPGSKEVWLSVVGRESLLPLERVVVEEPVTPEGAEKGAGERGVSSVPPPRGWALVLSLVSLLVFFTLWEAVRRSEPGDSFLGIDWRQFVFRRPHGDDSSPPARIVQAIVVLVPVVTAVPYLLLSGPYVSRFQGAAMSDMASILWPPSWSSTVMMLMIACPAALVVTTGALYAGLAQRTWRDLATEWSTPARSEAARRLERFGRRAGRLLGIALPILGVSAVVLCVAAFVAWGYGTLRPGAEIDAGLVFLLNRSIALGSGVSPLLPVLLLFTVVVGWVLASLWRHRTLDTLPAPPRGESIAPSGQASPARQLLDALAQVRKAVDPATFWFREYPIVWCVVVLVPVLYLSVYYGGLPGPLARGFEPGADRFPVYDWLVSVLLVAAVTLVLGSALSLLCGWRALRRWLERLKVLRLNPDEERTECRWLQELEEIASPESWSRTALGLGRGEAFQDLRRAVEDDEDEKRDRDERTGRLARVLRKLVRDRDPENPCRETYARTWLAIVSWIDGEARSAPAAVEGNGEGEGEAPPEPELISKAREFFVWQTGYFAREARGQLGQLMAFVTAGPLLLLLAVATYPFEPRRVLTFYFGSLVALGVVHCTVILVQMGRNVVLGNLGRGAGSDRGSSGWSRALIARIALYAGIPLLGLLTSQVPELRQLLSAWLEPVLKTFL